MRTETGMSSTLLNASQLCMLLTALWCGQNTSCLSHLVCHLSTQGDLLIKSAHRVHDTQAVNDAHERLTRQVPAWHDARQDELITIALAVKMDSCKTCLPNDGE
jgi:hypothetical protein